MTDAEWKSTACVLCYINCGIEVATEGRTITKVRGDKAHPGTRGYLCQKAQRLAFYSREEDRLTSPLRRSDDGSFEEIDWDTAISEIAARLATIRDTHGGESLAFYGGGGQGNHLGGPYGIGFLRALGCTSLYSSLAQEKTGDFWVNGHMFGSQICHTAEGIEEADLVIFLGANPWMAHGFRNARKELRTLSTRCAPKPSITPTSTFNSPPAPTPTSSAPSSHSSNNETRSTRPFSPSTRRARTKSSERSIASPWTSGSPTPACRAPISNALSISSRAPRRCRSAPSSAFNKAAIQP
jgi:hypothetical protein